MGMVCVSALTALYYNVILAWSFWYLFASIRLELPWSSCNSTWSTGLCSEKYNLLTANSCLSEGGITTLKGLCMKNNEIFGVVNETIAEAFGYAKRSSANDYLNQVGFHLKESDGMENLGGLRWDMSLALLLAWTVTALCLIKGIKSSGKVVYFTAIFPYIVLSILFVRGLLTDGYEEGIKYYITPDMNKLKEATVWKDAAVQMFFSLSTAFGGLITLSSYNKFKSNIIRHTLIITIGNTLTSVFAGFVVFSFLGGLAKSLNKEVGEVVDSGIALAFVVYPQAVTYLPFPPIWAILFFLMLLALGIDSEFILIETVTTSICDLFKVSKKWEKHVVVGACTAGFFISLVMATSGGPYLVTLMDNYSGGWSVMVIAVLEFISIAWVYGARRFCNDIEGMLGSNICGCFPWRIFRWWLIINWTVISPLLIICTIIFSLIQTETLMYNKYVFPLWANILGWMMTTFVLAGIVITPIIMILLEKGSLKERFLKLWRETDGWGPALLKNRKHVSENFDSKIIVDVSKNIPDDNLGFEMEKF